MLSLQHPPTSSHTPPPSSDQHHQTPWSHLAGGGQQNQQQQQHSQLSNQQALLPTSILNNAPAQTSGSSANPSQHKLYLLQGGAVGEELEIMELIVELLNFDTREGALLELSKKRSTLR